MRQRMATDFDRIIASRVRAKRMLAGMSQEKLAEHLGLTFQQVQKYEKGINRIGSGRLLEIAHHLGVPVTEFYAGLEAEPVPPQSILSDDAIRVAKLIDGLPDGRRAEVAKVVSIVIRANVEAAAV